MPIINKEMLSTPGTAQELHDQASRNILSSTFNQFNLITDVDNPQTDISSIRNNVLTFSGGIHGGLVIDRPNTTILGMGNVIFAPSILETDINNIEIGNTISLSVEADAKISNVRFEGKVFIGAEGVATNTGPTAIFENCIFEEEVHIGFGILLATAVTPIKWGKAHFIGCVFNGQPTALFNEVLNTNCLVIGCSRKGGPITGNIPLTLSETI